MNRLLLSALLILGFSSCATLTEQAKQLREIHSESEAIGCVRVGSVTASSSSNSLGEYIGVKNPTQKTIEALSNDSSKLESIMESSLTTNTQTLNSMNDAGKQAEHMQKKEE